MSFATIALHGNLGSDAETKYTTQGTMNVTFSIAVNDPRNKEAPATWYRVTAWDQLATRLDKLAQNGHLSKGSSLYVEGKLNLRSFKGNDGSTRWSFDVTMTNFEFTGSKQQQGGRTTEDAPSYDDEPAAF